MAQDVTAKKPDLATLLWLQTIRAHPELASGTLAASPVQERYDRILRERLGTASPMQGTGLESLLAGPVAEPAPDAGDVPGATGAQARPDTTRAPGRKQAVPQQGRRMTPFEMCLKDGGCDGIKR